MDFAVLADHRVKLKESEQKDKYFNLAWELKILWDMKVTFIPIVIGALASHQRISTRTRGLRNKRTSGDHPNYCIIEIGQNTEKIPGLEAIVVIQTPASADGKNSQGVI